MDIKDIEAQDFDIIESATVALYEIWKKRLLIILITIAGFLAALLFISVQGDTTRYYSSATLFSAVYGSYTDTTEGVAVMNRYTDLVGSSRVCGRAAQTLARYNITTEDIQKMVSDGYIKVSGASKNTQSYGTQLTVSVYAPSEAVAIPMANAMASALASEMNDLIGSDAIQVMDEANSFASFSTVNVPLYLILFSGIAFVVASGIIFCMVFFSPWVRSTVQCEQDDSLVLGILPYVREK